MFELSDAELEEFDRHSLSPFRERIVAELKRHRAERAAAAALARSKVEQLCSGHCEQWRNR